MRKAVFLDRDGVINRAIVRNGKPYPPSSLIDFEFLPGAEATMRKLRDSGFLVIVVTNQPDVRAGAQRLSEVEKMHDRVRAAGLVDDIKTCFHIDSDGCNCRKPRPGMLIEAAKQRSISLTSSYMVGDRWRDVAAGKAVGCRTFFIDYGYAEHQPESPDFVVASLAEAGRLILQE